MGRRSGGLRGARGVLCGPHGRHQLLRPACRRRPYRPPLLAPGTHSLPSLCGGWHGARPRLPGIAVALSRQVGADLFARAYGVIFLAWGLAGLTAPWLAGLLFDFSGGYDAALLLGLASAATAAAVGWTV